MRVVPINTRSPFAPFACRAGHRAPDAVVPNRHLDRRPAVSQSHSMVRPSRRREALPVEVDTAEALVGIKGPRFTAQSRSSSLTCRSSLLCGCFALACALAGFIFSVALYIRPGRLCDAQTQVHVQRRGNRSPTVQVWLSCHQTRNTQFVLVAWLWCHAPELTAIVYPSRAVLSAFPFVVCGHERGLA